MRDQLLVGRLSSLLRDVCVPAPRLTGGHCSSLQPAITHAAFFPFPSSGPLFFGAQAFLGEVSGRLAFLVGETFQVTVPRRRGCVGQTHIPGKVYDEARHYQYPRACNQRQYRRRKVALPRSRLFGGALSEVEAPLEDFVSGRNLELKGWSKMAAHHHHAHYGDGHSVFSPSCRENKAGYSEGRREGGGEQGFSTSDAPGKQGTRHHGSAGTPNYPVKEGGNTSYEKGGGAACPAVGGAAAGSSEAGSVNVVSGPAPEVIRRKLEKVMADKETFLKSAKASFNQFDADCSGSLTFEEVERLVARLCTNLQLPPVDANTLYIIFQRYDRCGKSSLTLDDFCKMYWQLLLSVRDKYYPSKRMRVRRDVFVGRQNLTLSGETIEDRFRFLKQLGSGAFGDVHLVQDRTAELERVIKIINKDRSAVPLEQIEAEINVLKSLDHPNVIKIFEVLEDYNNIYIVMETCKGGELLERISTAQTLGRPLSERNVSEVMWQLMSALAYFHEKLVVHKDLKPENILFHDKSPDSPIKVIDFGLAELFEQTDAHSRIAAGTALYMAPEVFRRMFSFKCDVWSSGVLLYVLLTGQFPFTGNTVEEVKHRVCHVTPDFKRDCQHLSSSAIDLLTKMLEKHEGMRPSARDVLKHPWFPHADISVLEISPLVCENMKKYMRQSQLKNGLVNLMIHQLNVNGSQIREINRLFSQLDTDGNGILSHEELTNGLLRIGIPKWDINRILQSIDVDDSGNVSYTEFLAACYTWRESELNVMWSAFRKLDKDGDGRISSEEFREMLAGHDSKLVDKSCVDDLVRQIDKDDDGQVDWHEFIAYMKGV